MDTHKLIFTGATKLLKRTLLLSVLFIVLAGVVIETSRNGANPAMLNLLVVAYLQEEDKSPIKN